MARTTIKSLQTVNDEQALQIQGLTDTLAKARKYYSELLIKYSAAIADKNTKPSGGFDAKGRRASHSVPSVPRTKSPRRIEMDAAKAKAAASGSSTTC